MANQLYWKVTSSGIHNQGLFAARDIPQGEKVIEYLGKKITKKQSEKRASEWEKKARKRGEGLVYIFEVNGDFDIDGNIPDNPAKYANHHCEPNCEAINEDDRIWFYSLRDIKKDEELTFDYGYGIENFLDHPCRCGASACVGYIVRKDQRWRVKRIVTASRNRKKLHKAEVS